ncbi:MAG TPA: hypothetical protein VFO13_06035 [Arthrobacter sp.]|nr:hypothetical protein [Arthrobacter sp.]
MASSISDNKFTKLGEDMGGTGARGTAYLQPLNLSRRTLDPTTPKPDKSHVRIGFYDRVSQGFLNYSEP